MITTFGDFYVSEMRWREPEARCVIIGNICWATSAELKIDISAARFLTHNLLNDLAKIADLVEPNEHVHLRKQLAQVTREPLRHTTAHDQFLIWPFIQAALLMRLQNCFDGFFLG